MPKDTPRPQVAGTDAGIEKEKVLKGIAVPQREFGPKQRPRVTVPREQTTSCHLPRRGFEMLTGGTEDPWIGPEGNKEGVSILGQKPHIPEVLASLWVPNSWLLCSLEMRTWFDSDTALSSSTFTENHCLSHHFRLLWIFACDANNICC